MMELLQKACDGSPDGSVDHLLREVQVLVRYPRSSQEERTLVGKMVAVVVEEVVRGVVETGTPHLEKLEEVSQGLGGRAQRYPIHRHAVSRRPGVRVLNAAPEVKFLAKDDD